ncbi:unnamed protein product [Ilex paraguariensis]|uniref:Uncharacterized protein n=1 Tax=Ilex paraguariensis TaxID=185542 RepID=A0ABC8R6T8_9AQUA
MEIMSGVSHASLVYVEGLPGMGEAVRGEDKCLLDFDKDRIFLGLPKGTHQWSSFLTPEELVLILQRASISVEEMAGFTYNPLTGRWSLSDDVTIKSKLVSEEILLVEGVKPDHSAVVDRMRVI